MVAVRKHYTEDDASVRWLDRAVQEAHSISLTGKHLGIPSIMRQAERLEAALQWHHKAAASAALARRDRVPT